MDWPTLGTSLGSAVLVAFFSPRFQHLVWKKQRLREQRISLAERFAKISGDLRIIAHLTPHGSFTDPAAAPSEDAAKFLEQEALLLLVQVLFERKRTLDSGTKLKKALG